LVLAFGDHRSGGDPFDKIQDDDTGVKFVFDLGGGFETDYESESDDDGVRRIRSHCTSRNYDEPPDFPLFGSEICGSSNAFALLKPDGSVTTWGYWKEAAHSRAVAKQLSSGVLSVVSNLHAFAAIKEGGSVVTWGDADKGGDSSKVAALLSSGVVSIVSSDSAFVALKEDCSVVSWGDAQEGGDSSAVAAFLQEGVREVFVAGGDSSSDANIKFIHC
jgi:hypothetical protein